jgi:hypothetical protein
MREIGGYLEFENLVSNPYYDCKIEVNSGRNALLYLIRARKIKKIFIPKFLCDSISNMLDKYGFEYDFYNIDTDFKPIFSKNLSDS